MPELPEVETMRRGVESIVGATITAVDRPACSKRPISIRPSLAALRRRMTGERVAAVERLGKRVVIRLAGGDRLVIEPRMTGLVLLADPPTVEHLRLRITLAGAAAGPRSLLFWDRRGLGTLRLAGADEFDRLYGPGRLGPDALALSASGLAERLAASRRAIKVALLDQRALAGVGNLYAAEILHVAGLSPLARCNELTAEDWARVHRAMRQVLNAAIRHEGSTLGDGTYRNALNQRGSYQNHHRVYGRAGKLCGVCRQAEVKRIVQAQRSTFYCPQCQPTRGDGVVGVDSVVSAVSVVSAEPASRSRPRKKKGRPATPAWATVDR